MENNLDINIEEKQMTVKEQREIKLIVENLELIKVIMQVFQGQVLYMDLQEFCLKFKVFDTAEGFAYCVEKLIKGKILKKTIYPNTQYVVLITKARVNRYINNVDDSIDFSLSQVRLNCFKNAILVRRFERPNCTLDRFIEVVSYQSTFFHGKYAIESAYKFFNSHLDLNDMAEKSFKCAMYKHTKGLKHVETVGSVEDELLSFENSFDTFVNKNIYTLYSSNKFTFYILDVNDNLNAEKVGKKIGAVIGTMYEQIEQLSLVDKLDTVKFVVLARDNIRRDKIVNGFRKSYYKEHIITSSEAKNDAELGNIKLIRAYKEHLLDATNIAVKKRVVSAKVHYIDRDKESNVVFRFRNVYETSFGLNIEVLVEDANLNDRLNMYTRIANIKRARENEREKQLKAKLRREIEREIYKEIELIHSATEDEIRRAIMREFGIEDIDMSGED